MENQPWKRGRSGSLWAGIRLRGLPATLILGLIFVLVVSLASPSLEVLANQITKFFRSSPSDQITIQIPIEDIIDPEARFNLSISEAEELAGFHPKTPASLPQGFSFSGAEHLATQNTIIMNYTSDAGDILRISQRPIGVEYQNISADAGIEIVEIGDSTGEYVIGSWKTTSAEVSDETPNIVITLQANWDPEARIQILRWQENEYLFKIIYRGTSDIESYDLDKDDLIRIANSIR
jgi:hypothetical protein